MGDRVGETKTDTEEVGVVENVSLCRLTTQVPPLSVVRSKKTVY